MRWTDFDAVLFDMDGTLYREHAALPGADRLISHLRRINKRVACVTNNSANTSDELSARLAQMGVTMPAGDIFTACHAMVDVILRIGHEGGRTPRVFNFAGKALPRELGDRAELVSRPDQPCEVVAVGTHMRENAMPFDFDRSLVGLELLRHGAKLVIGCRDRVFPVVGGGVEFGSGSWGALFAFGAGVEESNMHYAGKPEATFFDALLNRIGVPPSRCVIIGDNLESDIRGGHDAGMKTALVLTGITSRDGADRAAVKPDAVFRDLDDLYDKFA